LGIPREEISIVARTHDDEGALAQQSGGSPGSEIEDSRAAGRLGELSAHLLAAIALVMVHWRQGWAKQQATWQAGSSEPSSRRG
jgi:hypothetical protein